MVVWLACCIHVIVDPQEGQNVSPMKWTLTSIPYMWFMPFELLDGSCCFYVWMWQLGLAFISCMNSLVLLNGSVHIHNGPVLWGDWGFWVKWSGCVCSIWGESGQKAQSWRIMIHSDNILWQTAAGYSSIGLKQISCPWWSVASCFWCLLWSLLACCWLRIFQCTMPYWASLLIQHRLAFWSIHPMLRDMWLLL